MNMTMVICIYIYSYFHLHARSKHIYKSANKLFHARELCTSVLYIYIGLSYFETDMYDKSNAKFICNSTHAFRNLRTTVCTICITCTIVYTHAY